MKVDKLFFYNLQHFEIIEQRKKTFAIPGKGLITFAK